jgi:hypothetical protein
MPFRKSGAEPTRCVRCASTNVVKAPRAEYQALLFVIRRPYLCRECGALLEQPSHVGLCVIGFVVGALGLSACLWHAISTVRLLFEGWQWHRLALLPLDVAAILVALWIVFVSVGTAVWSVRVRQHKGPTHAAEVSSNEDR